MKKDFCIAFVIFVVFLSAFSVRPVKALATTYNVGPLQTYASISAALAVPPNSGDSIHVWNGPPILDNPVITISNIKIVGQSVAGAIIQPLVPGFCFTVAAPGVSIIGLTITDPPMGKPGDVGIMITPAGAGCQIQSNEISFFDYGIVISSCPINKIIGNKIYGCLVRLPAPPCSTAIEIVAFPSTSNIVRGNDIGTPAWPNSLGVETNGASGNLITYNNFIFNLYFPEATVAVGDLNSWDDGGLLSKGNYWSSGPIPPYTISLAPPNIDAYCSPMGAPYNWAAQTWDINRDLKCDMIDVATACKLFGKAWSMPGWNPIADLNADGKIDIKDIALICKHFGWKDP